MLWTNYWMAGCIFCNRIYSRRPEYLPYRDEFERLELLETSIGSLHKQFIRLKARDSLEVNVASLLIRYKIPPSSVCREVFCVGGRDVGVDFRTFTLCVWNICTQSDDSIGKIFDIRVLSVVICNSWFCIRFVSNPSQEHCGHVLPNIWGTTGQWSRTDRNVIDIIIV